MDLFTFSGNTGNLLGYYPKAFSRLYNYEVFSFDSRRMSAEFLSAGTGNQGTALGTAYAIWTGIGALGAVAIGIIFFKEPVTLQRLFFITLLLTGIIGLKVSSGH